MSHRTKLELTRIGKDTEYNLEPRILIERPDLSHDPDGSSDNLLIHGDNLLALKALEQQYAGQVKCIYIDPPYNTGNAFEHYDDGLEHSEWLNLMKPRLEMLRNLLSDEGVIFVQIDDQEGPYLKVLMDEIFGRKNYEVTFYIKVRHENRILREDNRYQLVMEQVFCYSKSNQFVPLRKEKTKNAEDDYIYDIEFKGNPKHIETISGYEVEIYDTDDYEIIKTSSGNGSLKMYQIRGSLITQSGSASEYYEKNLRIRRNEDGLGTLYKVQGMGTRGDGLGYRYIIQPSNGDSKNGFYFQGRPSSIKKSKGLPYENYYDFVDKFNNVGYEGGVEFRNGKKSEEYIKFFLELAKVKSGDIVLDSFLGSGTTAAVAHKMGYKWIGIELGDHAYTHAKVRMDKVIDGEQGGISKAVDWKGGGSYKFYELGPSLLIQDQFGQWIINKELDGDKLIQALCKIENYQYSYDDYGIKHGRSSETSFLHVTTRHINQAIIDDITKSHLGSNEGLLILARTFDDGVNLPTNIRLKKIPKSILTKCEYGRSDYNLPVTESDYSEEEYLDDQD